MFHPRCGCECHQARRPKLSAREGKRSDDRFHPCPEPLQRAKLLEKAEIDSSRKRTRQPQQRTVAGIEDGNREKSQERPNIMLGIDAIK